MYIKYKNTPLKIKNLQTILQYQDEKFKFNFNYLKIRSDVWKRKFKF